MLMEQIEPRGAPALAVTIANGTSLSPAFDTQGYDLVGIEMPAAWTAAGLSFQVAEKDGGTYQDLFDEANAEVTVAAVNAAKCYTFGTTIKEKLRDMRWMKIRSGTTGTPVNQAADRVLNLLRRQSGA